MQQSQQPENLPEAHPLHKLCETVDNLEYFRIILYKTGGKTYGKIELQNGQLSSYTYNGRGGIQDGRVIHEGSMGSMTKIIASLVNGGENLNAERVAAHKSPIEVKKATIWSMSVNPEDSGVECNVFYIVRHKAGDPRLDIGDVGSCEACHDRFDAGEEFAAFPVDGDEDYDEESDNGDW